VSDKRTRRVPPVGGDPKRTFAMPPGPAVLGPFIAQILTNRENGTALGVV